MSSSRRRIAKEAPRIAAFVILGSFAWLVWAGSPTNGNSALAARGESDELVSTVALSQLDSAVKPQLGIWHGTLIETDPRALEILETDDVDLMEYRMGEADPPVWFARVAGFGKRAAFHPPELCYVGSHFEILEREQISILVNGTTRDVMRLVIGQDSEQFEAWYWFTAGERTTHNYYQQQLWLLTDTIRRRPMNGTLVRISTPLNDGNKSAHRRLLSFMTAFDTSSHTDTTHDL